MDRPVGREHFAAIGQLLRVDSVAQVGHEIEIGLAKHDRHVLAFLHADAMFAGDGTA